MESSSGPVRRARKDKAKRKKTRDDDKGKGGVAAGGAGGRGVVYVGHIPHGFYEEEMKKYFSQFGDVTRLRLARSKKTGNSKGYAFVEFQHEEVAKVVAETMDNYLMFDKLLKCKLLESSSVHRRRFRGRRRFPLSWRQRARTQQQLHNQPKTVAGTQKRVERLLARERKKREALASLGLDYQYPGYSAAAQGSGSAGGHRLASCTAPTHTVFVDGSCAE